MKQCAIICNGVIDDYSWLASALAGYAMIIAADGGAEHCRRAGIAPSLVLGDMDSVENDEQNEKIIFPPEKDASDMELAVEHALSLGYREMDVYGALGGRIDHQLCNLMVCANHAGCLRIKDKHSSIVAASGGQEMRIEGEAGDIVTLAALADARCTTKGLRYPLHDEILHRGSRGLSNVMEDAAVSIRVSAGTVIIIHIQSRI